MGELKAFNMPQYAGKFTMHEVYLKSEADKVIAELEMERDSYKVTYEDYRRRVKRLGHLLSIELKNSRRHKYNRCLAMWLYLRECYWRCKHHNEKTRADWYEKWMDIFKKLAEHYKAAK